MGDYIYIYIYIFPILSVLFEGTQGVIVIDVGNGHSNLSSNPGQGYSYISRIMLGKVWINSLLLWVNCRTNWAFKFGRKRKILNLNLLNSASINWLCVTSCSCRRVVQVFRIVDAWKFSMLLLYILWDDWPIFMISRSNEQLQQKLEYTLLKPDCHSWGISKM